MDHEAWVGQGSEGDGQKMLAFTDIPRLVLTCIENSGLGVMALGQWAGIPVRISML